MTTPQTIDIPDTKVNVFIVVRNSREEYMSHMVFTNVSLTVIQDAMEYINVEG